MFPEDLSCKGREDKAGGLLQAGDETGLDLEGRRKRKR